ncbi:hypothetical protein D3C77_566900 [compost metagenome]
MLSKVFQGNDAISHVGRVLDWRGVIVQRGVQQIQCQQLNFRFFFVARLITIYRVPNQFDTIPAHFQTVERDDETTRKIGGSNRHFKLVGILHTVFYAVDNRNTIYMQSYIIETAIIPPRRHPQWNLQH